MPEFYVGVDVGKVNDFTAICIVSPDKAYRDALDKQSRLYERRDAERRRPGYDEYDEREFDRLIEEQSTPMPEPVYEVRDLRRLPLGMAFTTQARHLAGLLNTVPLLGSSKVAIDASGVGTALTDPLREMGVSFEGVVITGGDNETYERENDRWRVSKIHLVSRAQVLLQNAREGIKPRVEIASSLPEASTLVAELQSYRFKTTEHANLTFDARSGEHDDLVLALALNQGALRAHGWRLGRPCRWSGLWRGAA